MPKDSHLSGKMKRIIPFFVGLMLLWSCAEKIVEKPENLIPKEKMVHILHDLAVLNAAKSSFKSTLDRDGIEVMEFLYKKYQIDSVQFTQSDLYYASVPLEYQSIYEEVDDMLDKRKKAIDEHIRQRYDSIKDTRQSKADSVKALKKPVKPGS
ncbi:MAG: DUF4296 domain-containing protein [Allomuricauda sp.]